ncbi:MAG: metallophosphoesterase [Candidatus Hydrogenedentes bacterium]|nr:metallophosphoesterase [Candidatus Hydrogenedentota bacterium]
MGRKPIRFGLVTDSHYAEREPAGVRYYRESLTKMGECIDRLNAEKLQFAIETGDFKDQDTPPAEERTLAYLRQVEAAFQRFNGPTYHALGNHDMDSLSKAQFLAHVTNAGVSPERSYYSFDRKWLHIAVLDANFNPDGSAYDHGNFDWTQPFVPSAELDWLRRDLAGTRRPAIVFLHQLLDGVGNPYVNNADEVRAVLEAAGNVLAVFQGHHHSGSYSHVNGIHYYTLKAMIEGSGPENNSYAIGEVRPDGDITITGYRRAESMELVGAREAAAG